jgi:general stress protein 26
LLHKVEKSFTVHLSPNYPIMPAPKPEPFDPADLPRLATETMQRAKFPMLATVDGDQPRLRPVSPVRTDGFTVYVANLRRYGKTREIEANPLVELCYCDADHHQVRITGTAEVVTDRPLLEEIWANNPLLRAYLGSLENPEFLLYRIKANRVRYMKEWALEYHEVPVA